MTELFKDKSQEEIEQMLNDIIFVFSNAIILFFFSLKIIIMNEY